MTDRKTWPLAVSFGVGRMNAGDFEKMAENGIHEIELSSGKPEPFFETLDYPNKAKEISALAKAHGVNISSIHLPFGPFSQFDPAARDAEVREKLIAVQTELMNAAGDAGVTFAVIHPSGEPYQEEERAERLAIAADTIAKLTEAAGKAGMVLALENLPRTCLCRTSDEMLYFLDRIPDLRVVFDTNHSLTESNVHYIRAVGEKIVTLHVSDYDFIDERHQLPGVGKIDWEELISTLEEVGYQGRFLYETGHPYEIYKQNYNMLMHI
ncbi:MAG: sugar phosphate isomerase/epimerase [Clostridia bacterium]|nr:sugar phosphate isomerase/epimerase [Clostridia bacterium]MBQ8368351.1 sugar phosphate isomerase/epimerase [Clostridia bacterium]